MDISRRGFIKGASSALAFGLGSGSLLPLAAAAEETADNNGEQEARGFSLQRSRDDYSQSAGNRR